MRWLLPFLLSPILHAAEKPNILFLFADDLGRYASAYSDPDQPSANDLIDTPAFDRIAEEGAIFENAFISAPSCTPSRGAVYTGRHFFRNGSASQLHNPWVGDAADPFDKVEGMPITLSKAGYHIGWSHKWHLRESLMGGKQNQFSKHGSKINQYSQAMSKAKDPAATKAAIFKAVRDNFRDFVAKRTDAQPFFYSFNPTNTHRTWTRGSGKKLWGIDPDQLKGRLPSSIPDTEVIREDFADYLGEVMAFDEACAVIIDELRTMGELDNTLVVISGDHGAPGFTRGKCNVHDFGSRVLLAMRWPGNIAPGRQVMVPVSLVDLAPTFLAAAGLQSKDDPNGEDLLPALREGADDSKLRGWALIGRERHVGSARSDRLPYPVRAIRTPDFLYIRNFKPDRWPMGEPFEAAEPQPDFASISKNTRAAFPDLDASPTKTWLIENRDDRNLTPYLAWGWMRRPADELYDLKKDPNQLRNLAKDPSYQERLVTLRKRLMTELETNQDPRLEDRFDKAPYRSMDGR
ncbi:sulfatase family protein [Haloferula rosea]|uniref:Sulfatase n=1 Tax=Haloferula rosea TaxID=490093 RepID=A0A934RD31_9BACT|nr:sulfatase [Haloferula rosea]MBK1827367.1 sulfatase [Haloferula rosea]